MTSSINGSDNFPTRYLVNDACHMLGIPLVDACIFMFEGQATVYKPAQPAERVSGGPCYRCLYPDPPPPGEVPSCAEAGVLGVLPGIIGSIQAVEAIKLIAGIGEPLVGRLLLLTLWSKAFARSKLSAIPPVPCAATTPSITELIDYEQFCGFPAGARNRSESCAGITRAALFFVVPRSRAGGEDTSMGLGGACAAQTHI